MAVILYMLLAFLLHSTANGWIMSPSPPMWCHLLKTQMPRHAQYNHHHPFSPSSVAHHISRMTRTTLYETQSNNQRIVQSLSEDSHVETILFIECGMIAICFRVFILYGCYPLV
jgi:hypothetical protein